MNTSKATLKLFCIHYNLRDKPEKRANLLEWLECVQKRTDYITPTLGMIRIDARTQITEFNSTSRDGKVDNDDCNEIADLIKKAFNV